MIKTTKGIVFGGIIQKPISNYRTINENGEIEGIIDPQSFVFTFNKGLPMRYLVKQSKKKESSFFLYDKYDTKLCVFGDCDIWIPKSGKSMACVQTDSSFYEYQGKENALVGISGKEEFCRFEIQHLIAIEFCQLYKKSSNSIFGKTIQSQSKSNQMNQNKQNVMTENVKKVSKGISLKSSGRSKMSEIDIHRQHLPKEIEIIEKWTNLFYKEILFNSETNKWNKNFSEFDSKIMKKENLVFFIETFDGILLGGFLKKKITATMRKISDADAFVFSNNTKKLEKYSIKITNKYDAFQLSSQQDKMLFNFGNDLFIAKEDFNGENYVNERNCFFNYGNNKNVLLGKIGKFVVKKIVVYQLG